MATIRMDINPEVLKYFIDNSEFDLKYLKSVNNLSNIEDWINGSKQPTLNQLKYLAKKLRIPLGYLVLKEPIDDTPPILNYRTVDSVESDKGSRELIDTIKIAQEQQEFVSDYRKREGFSTLKYVGYYNLDESVQSIVEFSRTLLGISESWQKSLNGKEPIKFFREKLNKIGVLVLLNGIVGQNTHRTLDLEEFRAFVIIDAYAPAIFINTNDTKNGQVFSLLHEFGHVLFGKNEVYNVGVQLQDTPSELEIKCNAFASEILVPNELFIDLWSSLEEGQMLKAAQILADKFKVSPTVIARKALDNKFVTEEEYNYIADYNYQVYKDSKEQRRNRSDGGNYWNNLNYKIDPVVYNTVRNSFLEGDLPFTKALKLLGVNSKAFDYLEENDNHK